MHLLHYQRCQKTAPNTNNSNIERPFSCRRMGMPLSDDTGTETVLT